MKIHILLNLIDGPYGGSHKFLNSLRAYLRKRDFYAEAPEDAEVFLFDSSQEIPRVTRYRLRYPNRKFIHRLDGITTLYNRTDDPRDKIVLRANRWIADGTIFQSEWSKREFLRLGLSPRNITTTVQNAPDSTIFYPRKNSDLDGTVGRKIKVIISSWSKNWRKGFEDYQWLDKWLSLPGNKDRFDFTFVGNSPVYFTNINMIPALSPQKLADELRGCDIYITASEKDACSNSLLEALSCGLPCIAKNDGGNPELINKGGLLFDEVSAIPVLLEKIVKTYPKFVDQISIQRFDEVAQKYINFSFATPCRKKSEIYLGFLKYFLRVM